MVVRQVVEAMAEVARERAAAEAASTEEEQMGLAAAAAVKGR